MPQPLEIVAPYCDITQRLAAVPPDAEIRGIWFRAIEDELRRRGLRDQYAAAFPKRPDSLLRMYPATEYLTCVAYAGALVASPERLHEGMYAISLGNARYFAGTLLGRGMMHLLSRRDPHRIAEQAVASKRHTTNYGRWYVASEGPRHIEIALEDEFVWIESTLLGAAAGTFEVIPGARCEAKLHDRFNGSIFVHL